MSVFKSDADRELWIKLNAERQIEWEKGLTYYDRTTNSYKPTGQALHPRTMDEAMEISRNQCKYDEEHGELRFTMEELLLLDIDGLNAIQLKHHQDFCKKNFELR